MDLYPSSILRILSDDDSDSEERAVNFVRTLARERHSESIAVQALDRYLHDVDSGERMGTFLSKLLDDEDGNVAFSAASCLLAAGDVAAPNLAVALIRRGSGWYERRVEASRMLDELRKRPLVGAAVSESLQQALWGVDEEKAWSTAVYIFDTGERKISGLARALAFVSLRERGFSSEGEGHLRFLLHDPETRAQALEALRARP